MSSTPAYYTDLFPKQGYISGLNDQALFGMGKDVLSFLGGGIKAKTIAAIGTLALGTSIVQYLFAPKIHHDLVGAPKSIVGNASNKLGGFSCVSIPLASLKLFACVAQEDKVVAMLPHLLALENEALSNTDWFDSENKYVGLLCPTSSSYTLAKNHLPGN